MNSRVARVAPLLFGSGTCALIYQVVWLREMRLIFGASTAASAAVLAIFMGGLGLGGALFGRRADRHPRPLVLYAQLELMIALSAAVTPGLVELARHAYVATGGTVTLGLTVATAVRLALAAVVLCVPTLLMGGTLPAAAKAVETDEDASRRNLAVLYGVNTLGAVTGAFVSTFFLLEILGARMTLWLACGLNLGVALTGIAIARTARFRVRVVGAPPASAAANGSAGAEAQRAPRRAVEGRGGRVFVLAAAGVVGFAFLLMELVWYRMLAPLLGGSSFTFGLILAVALLGIGLGGTAYALGGSSRPATLRGFALSCALEALCIAFPYALGDRIAFLTLLLRPLGALGFYGLVVGWTLVAALVVLPAAFVAGVQFPLLIGLLGRGQEHVGRDTGLAYAWNTVGAICGALAGGFGLLPLLSAPGAWSAVVALLVALGLIAVVFSLVAERTAVRVGLPLAAAAGAVLMLAATGPTAVWRHGGIGVGSGDQDSPTHSSLYGWANTARREIDWETDGVESSVALRSSSSHSFIVNGKIDGNAVNDAPTQIFSGLIPAILHPKPTRALVIGLGTGESGGWLGAIPTMERVDVVELEPAIVRVAAACAAANLDALRNPKVHVVIGDGREVLLTTRQRYDVIMSEPSNPYRAGVASLFTEEFYQAVAARLDDGGIFAQWLQAYNIESQTVRTAYATLAAVFPFVETWQTGRGDLLLVAARQPITYDVPALRARVQQEPFKTALSAVWRVTDVEGFLTRYIANSAFATAVAKREDGVLNTDDRTLMEFAFARSVGHETAFSLADLQASAQRHGQDRPPLTDAGFDWSAVDDQRIGAFTSDGSGAAGIESRLSENQSQRLQAHSSYLEGEFAAALEAWRGQPAEPAGPVQLALVAESLADAGEEDAVRYVEQLRAFQPAEADAILGRLRWKQGRLPEATDALQAAFARFQQDPWPVQAVMTRAMDVAEEIAATDKILGLRLYQLLRTPFAVSVLNDARLNTLIRLATQLDFEHLCVQALEPFEPYPAWGHKFLAERARCYKAVGHPRAAQAQRDLDALVAEQPAPFAHGLEVPSPSPAAES